MSAPLEVVVVGAGQRAQLAYGPYAEAFPEAVRIVAVAEPLAERRRQFAGRFDLDDTQCYSSWQELLARPQLAPALLNLTQDPVHVESTLAALARGYHVLLEKPMAQTPVDCARLVLASERSGRILQICHVLRFAPFFAALHAVVQSGRLGQIVSVEHRENIYAWHMAHGYVRGKWGSQARSGSPLILAKCCHDLDILYWNHGPARRIGSFGGLRHFRPENAPPGAPRFCADGCPVEAECPFYAPRIYGGPLDLFPAAVITDGRTEEARQLALRTGPYGRCVYHCDNDVVDHQVVAMEMESGISVSMTFVGHSHLGARTIRVDGSRATLRGSFSEMTGRYELEVHDHCAGTCERVPVTAQPGGHGGGDFGLMHAFVEALRAGRPGTLTSARNSMESHLMAFAAEAARRGGTVVPVQAYRAQVERLAAQPKTTEGTL